MARRSVLEGIQIRADSLKDERPRCPRSCRRKLHRHGGYWRYAHPRGEVKFYVERFLCVVCNHTVSVLPVGRITYRPLEVKRLQSYLDSQGGLGSGPDPPPDLLEAGCLRRAWIRFLTRVEPLKTFSGQMLRTTLNRPGQFWLEMRRCFGSLEEILSFLARTRKCSLLGDYACLRPAP